MITVASIVEGHGEVAALPHLIRRVAYEQGFYDVRPLTPHRLARDKFLDPLEFGRAVELQTRRIDGRGGVIALVDGDDDCAVELAAQIRARYSGHRQFALLVSVREYESIFLAALGVEQPEAVRGAKERLVELTGNRYRETVDQAKLTAAVDLGSARDCRWFRKFEKDLLAILRG